MAAEPRDDGVLTAVAGASRMGKTGGVKLDAAGAARILVWDTRGEYVARDEHGWPGCTRIETIPELARALRGSMRAPGRFAYFGALSDFDAWCRLAYLWIQAWPATVVADEIADVTHPGKAPDGWGILIRKGLYYGAHVYAISQRPSESDKTTWGNATVLRCHALRGDDDRTYMARRLGCTADELASLRPLEYVQTDFGAPGEAACTTFRGDIRRR